MIEEYGAAGGEAGHEVFFAEAKGVKGGDGVLLWDGRDGDFELAQSVSRKGANVGAASASGEGFLGAWKVEEPAQIVGEENIGVGADDEELAPGDGRLVVVEEASGHAGAASGEKKIAGAKGEAGSKLRRRGDEIGLGGAEDAVFGKVADADELMSAGGVVPRRIGTTQGDAERHGGDFTKLGLGRFHEKLVRSTTDVGRIATGRDGVLGAELTVAPLDGDFAAALVAKVCAGGINSLPLGVVNARCATRIIALIGPCALWALGNYSILWLTHVGD